MRCRVGSHFRGVVHILTCFKEFNMQRDSFNNVMNQLEAFALGFEPFFRDIRSNFTTYPPHNVVTLSETMLCLELAVAGFKREDITITESNGTLTISGDKSGRDEPEYAYKGIGSRSFTKTFKVSDLYDIDGAKLEDGILSVTFIKRAPEEEPVRKIKIK